MKPLKLYMDARPGEIPENSYPYGKNGIQHDLTGAVFNEPGFLRLAAVVPYNLNGVIETDGKPVLMSTDETNSAIGFLNTNTGLYEPIVDDNPLNLVNWPANGERLGFKRDWYITGQAQRNYKGELVIAFTDKHTFPKYLNCDVPAITRLDDLRLFPYYYPPVIDLTEGIGGSLEPGTYYVSTFYEKNDGTTTQFSEVSQGLTISPGETGSVANKSISILLTNADLSYDYVRVAVISKINGKTSAVVLLEQTPISAGTIEILYTGDNLSDEITVTEILTPQAVYERVGTIGQLNDALYIGNLEKEVELINGLQKYVNLATVRWKSELIDATSVPEDHRNGKRKYFMHEETYALYIRFHKTRGGFTRAYHLPGLPLLPQYSGNSTEAVAGGETAAVPKHKVEDCIPFFDTVTKTGVCGSWVNEVEQYPDHEEFDSTTVGGANLRNQNVMHHRMPSLRWCKNNLYANVPEYGKTKLDGLTLEVQNLSLPDEYDTLIDGYELLYAKRTPNNMTVYGQAPLLHGAVAATEVNIATGSANIYTTGGNWRSVVTHRGKGDYNDDWDLSQLRQDTMRIHPFDVLLNKPNISPSFVSAQYRIRREKLKTEGYLEDGAEEGPHNMPTSHLVDYTLGTNPQSIPAGKTLRKIKTGLYLNIGVVAAKFNNSRHETCFAGTLAGTNWPLNNGEMGFRIRGESYTESALISDYEEAYMVNLIALKRDIYSSFYSQKLVSAGHYKAMNDTSEFYGGDTFICDYTYHTYGRHDQIDTEGDGIKGKKVIRRVICESASNIHLRYEIPGNEYSKWYPKTSVTANNPLQCYVTTFDRSKDPNQFGYSKDLNALNDFISSYIFNPDYELITKFPYRVHRLGKMSKQTKPRSWRTALPLDFYEMQKNMGVMVNIDGMYDRLLIHMENALFVTQDKAKLDAGLLSVTLGTGDIFQFEPQEAQQSKLGYAGTTQDLACVKTPVGYVFPDTKQGELYIWAGGKPENLGVGINTFLREYLKVKEVNPYNGNGITIGWDQKYKRLLITVKNRVPAPAVVVKEYSEKDEFFENLQVGDIVNYYGRYIKYMGLNNPEESGFDCEEDPPPPDQFAWEADVVLCEQDSPLTSVPLPVPGAFINLSSPAELLYNTTNGKLFLADHDQVSGNFYSIDTETGVKTYITPGVPVLYSIVKDKQTGKLIGSGLTGGLYVLNTSTELVNITEYGTDAVLSRKGLWIIGEYIVCMDVVTNSLYFIDRESEILGFSKHIGTDIPEGAVHLTENFALLDVNGNALMFPERRGAQNLVLYNTDMSEKLAEITSGFSPVQDWGMNMYMGAAFYDTEHDKLYYYDTGSSRIYIYNGLLVSTGTIGVVKVAGTHSVIGFFVQDPVNSNLYFCYKGVEDDGVTVTENRVYRINRNISSIDQVYMDTELKGQLERYGSSPYMFTAVPGKRYWEGTGWNTDGEIIKYAHGTI